MKQGCILILFCFLCLAILVHSRPYFRKKDSFRFVPIHKNQIGIFSTHGEMKFDFLTNLTLSCSVDDDLSFFHFEEKMENMSLEDKYFLEKPFCEFITLHDQNGTKIKTLQLETDGKYFRMSKIFLIVKVIYT